MNDTNLEQRCRVLLASRPSCAWLICRKAWFDENSRGENGALRELALDDALWDQFNRDYDAWYAERPRPGAPGRLQP